MHTADFHEPGLAALAPGAAPSRQEDDSLPTVLRRQRVEWYQDQFDREYAPVGPTEMAVVRDLARQAAAMEFWDEAAGAAQRRGACKLPPMAGPDEADPEARHDVLLASAVATEAADRCQRYGLGHTRAFYRALSKLAELQSRRKERHAAATAGLAEQRWTEADCEAHLRRRLQRGQTACRRCGGRKGHYLASRRLWQCSRCKTQAGLRAGTVMARSPLPLATWFAAIGWLLCRPAMSVAELASKLQINRRKTASAMARKIRAAMAADNVGDLLAGLDDHYGRGATAAPRPPALGALAGQKKSSRQGGPQRAARRCSQLDGQQPLRAHVLRSETALAPPEPGARRCGEAPLRASSVQVYPFHCPAMKGMR